MKALIHATIYDFHTYREDCFVLFDEAIRHIGDMTDYRRGDNEEIDCQGRLVMPGLVNGHTHIYSTLARGRTGPFAPTNFVELLEQRWWNFDRNLRLSDVYHSGIVAAVDSVRHGITTIIDHNASGAIIGSLEQLQQAVVDTVGLRGVFCFETSDRFDVEQAIRENRSFAAIEHKHDTAATFGLHASFTLSDDTLAKVAKQRGLTPIHIHVAESEQDQELALKRHGMRVVPRLESFGLLVKDALLAHCIHTSDEELAIIRKHRAVIAVNVTSNMNNGVGLPDIRRFRKHGIDVIIGNDGISHNIASEYLSLYFAMHEQARSPLGFDVAELIDLIDTTYAYASRRLGVKLGRIEPGYAADLILIPYDPPTPMTVTNAMGHMIFGLFRSFLPDTVFIGGKPVLTRGQVPSNVQASYRRARDLASALWERVAKEESA